MKNYKFTINGNKYSVEVGDIEDNTVNVEVNGTPYKVELDTEISTRVKPVVKVAGPAPKSAPAAAPHVARPPVVKVGCARGIGPLLIHHLLCVEIRGRHIIRRHVILGRARQGVQAAECLGDGTIEISRIDAVVVIPLGSRRGEHAVAGIAA